MSKSDKCQFPNFIALGKMYHSQGHGAQECTKSRYCCKIAFTKREPIILKHRNICTHTHMHSHYPCCETECFLFWLMDLLTTSFSLYQLPFSIKDPCSTRFPSMAPFPVGTISQQTLWPMLPLCQAVYTSSGNRTCVCQCVT